MIILTTSIGYSAGELSVFWDSLVKTDYKGKLVVLSDECNVLKDRGAEIIKDYDNGHPINSRRYLAYRDFLKGVKETVILTDIRDVVFQKNPQEHMPFDGLNVFEENDKKRIIDCAFNSMWMKKIGVDRWSARPIICSGVTSGTGLHDYCYEMWKRLEKTEKIIGIDQAVHNDLIYSGFPANIYKNEEAPVYTVGHLPLESVKTNDWFICNKRGDVPCMVHMYDRHVNLTVAVIKRLELKFMAKTGETT